MKGEIQLDEDVQRAIERCFDSFDHCTFEYFSRGGQPRAGKESDATRLMTEARDQLAKLEQLQNDSGDVRQRVIDISNHLTLINRSLVSCLPAPLRKEMIQ